jgi:small GTP-binding protein
MTEDKLKIVVFGVFGAGKTTLIRTLDPQSKHVEADAVGGTTTIALDFGRVDVNGRHVYLFGTPGQERFEFAREVIARGMDGAILLADATSPVDEFTRHLHDSLAQEKIPFVVMVNKCEEVGAHPDMFREHLCGAPVYTMSAKDHRRAFDTLCTFVATLPPGRGHMHGHHGI